MLSQMDEELIDAVKQDLQQSILKIWQDDFDQAPITTFLKICKETQIVLNSVIFTLKIRLWIRSKLRGHSMPSC